MQHIWLFVFFYANYSENWWSFYIEFNCEIPPILWRVFFENFFSLWNSVEFNQI